MLLHYGDLVLRTCERRGVAGHTYVRAVWEFRGRQIFNLGKMICYACERDFVFNLLGRGCFFSVNYASFKQKSHASHMLSISV